MVSIGPDAAEFRRLSKKYNLIPVCREVLADLETPVSAYLKAAADKPYTYLLESVEGGEKVARWSFVGIEPHLVFSSKGKRIRLTRPDGGHEEYDAAKDPLNELEKLLGRYRCAPVKGLPPFPGGAVGYLSYDIVRFIERIPDKNPDALKLPDSLFLFTDTLLAFDHVSRKVKVVCNVRVDDFPDADAAWKHAVEKIDEAARRLGRAASAPLLTGDAADGAPEFKSNFTKSAFEAAVRRAKGYIQIGDAIQIVLSQAFRTPVRSNAFSIYRALRSVNPSPYMFYLNFGSFQLAGSSPEIHVRCQDGKASLRPIAGTRKRGKTPSQDAALEKELLADPKERAEHVMLVDLGRNDLGRVCEYKSVKVRDFMTIERYSHVMHIVSHVEGVMGKGKTPFDLLRATFPAGTISGAPKVRAMEIIDELENQRRGVYSGIVGYFGYSGNLDSCIAIRTIVVKDGQAYVQAGAGIVADSDPAAEYDETVNKARALMKAIEIAETGLES